ncbi:streptophobe family protein [Streptomyces sp. NPDC047928]|uniref:streptophobe family protein n=1 Tax=unclassified Streptomyces TaxID=2593676 RepID=UPI00372494FD
MGTGDGRRGRGGAIRRGGIDWGGVLSASVAAVGWALVGMAGTAALGLRLLEADTAAPLGPLTAAVMVLAVGGSVTPSGEVSAFGRDPVVAETAADVIPLGVTAVGALLLSYVFLRSLRTAGAFVPARELAVRIGVLTVLFSAAMSGPVWAGRYVATFDGVGLPGVGSAGGARGLLPERLGQLVAARTSFGFGAEAADTAVAACAWVLGVVTCALLVSRRAPLPAGRAGDAVRRVVRPAVSALVTVVLGAVGAGYAAAGWAAVGAEHPGRVAGAALLGAPNGVGFGFTLGLHVPWHGEASGTPAELLPGPLGELLRGRVGGAVTLPRLAELDSRVWLLGVIAVVLMLCAGVSAAVRTPTGGLGPVAFAGRCGVRLGAVTAAVLPLVGWLSGLSVGASVRVLGYEAFDARLALAGDAVAALLVGAAWGAVAGAAGAVVVYALGAAGSGAALRPVVAGPIGAAGAGGAAGSAGPMLWPGPGGVGVAGAPGVAEVRDVPAGARRAGGVGGAGGVGRAGGVGGVGPGAGRGAGGGEPGPGPYRPSTPYRPPNPDTNPYLRVPGDVHEVPTVRASPPPRPGRNGPEDTPPDGPPPPGRPGRSR